MPSKDPDYLSKLRSLDIHKLESLPIFDQIVHKLVSGESAWTVAKWCHEQKIDVCGLFTWKRRVESLARRVRSQLETIKPGETAKATKFTIQQLIAPKKVKKFEMPDAVDLVAKLDASMMAAIPEINAERILKTAYLLQLVRVDQMMNMEAKVGMPFRWGHKNIEVLVQIGESLRKLEAGEFSNHGRRDEAFGRNTRGSLRRVPEGREPAGRYKDPLDAMKSHSGIHD